MSNRQRYFAFSSRKISYYVNAIPKLTAGELAAKLPLAADQDLVDYGPASDPKRQFELILRS
jgi:hypothetical protein